MKLIFIEFQGNPTARPGYYYNSLNSSDFSFAIRDCFSRRFSDEYLKTFPDTEIEIWTCYSTHIWGNRGIVKDQYKGLTFVSFPWTKIFGKSLALSAVKKLEQKKLSKEKFVVVLQNLHDINQYLIIRACKDIPIVAQQRSNQPPIYKFKYFSNADVTKKFYWVLSSNYEKKILNNLDYVFCIGKGERDYIAKNHPSVGVNLGHNTGFNYDSIPKYHKINNDNLNIVAITRYNSMKGVKPMLSAFKSLKENTDCNFTIIGRKPPNKIDKFGDIRLYEYARKLGIDTKGHLSHKEVINTITKSNLNWTYIEGMYRSFTGVQSGSVETMAYNIPQINNVIESYPGDFSKLGYNPRNARDIASMTSKISENLGRYNQIHKDSKQYYHWPNIIKKHNKIHIELMERYS